MNGVDPFDIPHLESADVEVEGIVFRVSRETEMSWLVERALPRRTPMVARIQLTSDGWRPDSMYDGVNGDAELLWERALRTVAHFPIRMHPAHRFTLMCVGLTVAVFIATLIYGLFRRDERLLVAIWGLGTTCLLLVAAIVALVVARVTRHWDIEAGRWSRRVTRKKKSPAAQ